MKFQLTTASARATDASATWDVVDAIGRREDLRKHVGLGQVLRASRRERFCVTLILDDGLLNPLGSPCDLERQWLARKNC